MGPVGVARQPWQHLIGKVKVSAISNMKRGIKSSENREHGPLRGLGAVGLPHMVPGTCTTAFHLLSYLAQHIPHP
jgi:hypothetical protein